MAEDIPLEVSGVVDIDESILVSRIKEAISKGSKKIHIINGYSVNTNSNVRVLTGPILGEITSNSAVVLLEVFG